jgi:cation:H+ antiporter
MVAGNIIGSSISNLFLVLGLTTVFSPRSVRLGDEYIFIDLHFLVGSAFLLVIMMWDGLVRPMEGAILLAGYVIYVIYLLQEGNTEKDLVLQEEIPPSVARKIIKWRDILIILVSSLFIFVGANYTIMSLEKVAGSLGISKAIISVTLLSLGTTLPEAVVSIAASRQGKADIAIGNILGSCIFNAFSVTGIASLLSPIHVTQDLIALSLPVYLVGVVMFYLITQDKRISRWEGMLFLLFYILFMAKIAGIA